MMRASSLSGVPPTRHRGASSSKRSNAARNQAIRDPEELLLARLGEVALAKLSGDFHRRLKRRGGSHQLETVHAK
jgi:hypothetical protein